MKTAKNMEWREKKLGTSATKQTKKEEFSPFFIFSPVFFL